MANFKKVVQKLASKLSKISTDKNFCVIDFIKSTFRQLYFTVLQNCGNANMTEGISNEYKIVVMKMEFCTPNHILWKTHNQLRRTLSLYVVILLIFPSLYCTEKIIYFKHIIASASVIISVDEFCTPPTQHLSFIYSWSIKPLSLD